MSSKPKTAKDKRRLNLRQILTDYSATTPCFKCLKLNAQKRLKRISATRPISVLINQTVSAGEFKETLATLDFSPVSKYHLLCFDCCKKPVLVTNAVRCRIRYEAFPLVPGTIGWLKKKTYNMNYRVKKLVEKYEYPDLGSIEPEEVVEWLQKRKAEGEGELFCRYCNRSLSYEKLQFDHYIPLSKEGRNAVANLAISCPRCNFYKRNWLPEQWLKLYGFLVENDMATEFFRSYIPRFGKKTKV